MRRPTTRGGAAGRRGGGSRTAEPPTRRTVDRFSLETRAAVEAAEAAGRILLRQLGRPRAVRLKSAKDPVTAADTAAERRIRTLLRARFPRIGFLGEEGGGDDGPDGRWIVDPLDGTVAFVAGLPFFSVLIALERRDTVESSVSYFPALRECYVAERGRGAWLNGRRIRVSARRRLLECVVAFWPDDAVWGSRSLRERIAALALRVRNLRIFGAGYALANVAAGRLDGYWEQSAYPWDIAAGSLLVREAGGRVTDARGGPLDLRQRTVLASNGLIHRRLVEALAPTSPRARRN